MLKELAKAVIKNSFNQFGCEIHRVWKPPPAHEDPRYAWLRNIGVKTVLDIGANEGTFARMMAGIVPGCQIYAFEPLADFVAALKRNLGNYPSYQVFTTALGSRSGAAMMHKHSWGAASSLLEMTDLHLETYPVLLPAPREVQVNVVTLDEIAEKLKLDGPILIKIDVEGYTKPVMEGGRKTLTRADVLVIEASYWPLYRDQILFDWVYDALRAQGFHYVGNFAQQVSPTNGSVLQADAVFLSEAAYRRVGKGLRAA